MASCWEIVTSLSFFQFMTNWEQSGSRIPNAYSVKLIFSLTAAFYQKTADISKIKRALVLKDIFSETAYMCVLPYQILSF